MQRFKQMTQNLLQHSYVAVLLTIGISFLPVVNTLGIVYAGLVTLYKGVLDGAVITIAATLPIVFILLQSSEPNVSPNLLWVAISLPVIMNLLTWVFASMLYRHMNWSSLLQVAALSAVLVISIIHLVFPDVAAWWGVQLTNAYQQASSTMPKVLQTKASADSQIEFIASAKNFADGMIAVVVLLCSLSQLAVSRWWQAAVFAPGLLRRELHHIRLSPLAGVLFTLSLIFLWVGNGVVSDIMPILFLLFMTAGLSVMHYLLGLMVSPSRWFFLVLMYVLIIYAFSASMGFLVMIALLDIWLDLRKKLRKI